ncbi:hypothetical protein B0H10DRAFT_1650507, partial [Mycena sp. CBHHK59/15]
FAYNVDGALTVTGIPIFECGDGCSCDHEKCRNRVRVSEKRTGRKRLTVKGVFAGEDIAGGRFINTFGGELITDDVCEARHSGDVKCYLFDIDFKFACDSTVKYVLDQTDRGNVSGTGNLERQEAEGPYTQNHSCKPNCTVQGLYVNNADMEKPTLALFASKDISAGEELCISYGANDIE